MTRYPFYMTAESMRNLLKWSRLRRLYHLQQRAEAARVARNWK